MNSQQLTLDPPPRCTKAGQLGDTSRCIGASSR
jgi:hypothetical protein